MMLNDSIVCDLAALLIINIVGIVLYFKWKYAYWAHKNLPFLEPCIPFGTMENPVRRSTSLGFWIKSNYDELKARGHKHGGIYNFAEPIYLPIAPEYVKNILQSDFQHFVDRAFYYNKKDDPLSAHLFAIKGQEWRNLRTKVTPTLTAGKVKMIFDIFARNGQAMCDFVENLTKNNQELDIKDIVSRFAIDDIAATAFGLDSNSFKNTDSDFFKYAMKIFTFTKLDIVTGLIALSRPKLANFLKIRAHPKACTDFFRKVIRDTIKYRETNKVVRKDILQALIDIKNNTGQVGKDEGTNLTVEEITAHAFLFFGAGFETSSTTLTYCFYELASDKKIQAKVRKEINDVLEEHEGKITYESIMDMSYMTHVVEETLRKYPSAPYLTRTCVRDYKVPQTDVVIEKGTKVFIPMLGLQRDAEFYPDPEKFNPERFTKENKDKRREFTYLPFGEGQRKCLGGRYAMVQIKVGLTILLKNFEFSVNSKTKVPLEIYPYKNIYATKGTIWLDTKKIEENVQA